MRCHAASEQEQGEVCQHHAVAQTVQWFVCCAVDVARHDAVQIAPADYEAEGYATLVDTFGVVGTPGNCVWSSCCQRLLNWAGYPVEVLTR